MTSGLQILDESASLANLYMRWGTGLPVKGILLLATYSTGELTTECRFEVSVNGGPFVSTRSADLGQGFVNLPSETDALSLSIRAIPTTSNYWGIEGHFKYWGNGNLAFVNAPQEFCPPRLIYTATFDRVILLAVVLSKVSDVTAQVIDALKKPVPAGGNRSRAVPTPWPRQDWITAPLRGLHYIASPPVVRDNIQCERRDIDPDADNLVLEVAGPTRQPLIGVSWPRSVVRTSQSQPTPFLIYFHPNVWQNITDGFYVGRGLGTYPFGWDFLFFGIWNYLNYKGDPLTDNPFAKGLPYQIKASGKSVVCILPSRMPKKTNELGLFSSAKATNDILSEIQAFMFRRAGIPKPPPLGRTALAAFSNGNQDLAQFLKTNSRDPFCKNTLQEIYIFDPSSDSMVWGCLLNAKDWSDRGANDTKMIRVYTRGYYPAFDKELPSIGRPILGEELGYNNSPAFVWNSRSSLNTVAILTENAWRAAINSAGGPPQTNVETHQLISAMMLTDALRRSNF